MKVKIGSSTLELIKGDITKQRTEAIVNAANKKLAPGGGVAGAIHRVAGPELWEECEGLGGCRTGEAKMTKGYRLPARYVVHTVGPVYSGDPEDAVLLGDCYINSLKLALKSGIKNISFPAISTGVFGYPLEEAAIVALRSAIDFLKRNDGMDLIRFVLYSDRARRIHETRLKELVKKDSDIELIEE